MAGDVEYKRRFATGSRARHWATWQSPSWKMLSYELGRWTKRALGALAPPWRSSAPAAPSHAP
jgi:hypothetical protein